MKERPILFSAPMVRAILEGRKTQTRRVVKDETVVAAAESFCQSFGKMGRTGKLSIGHTHEGFMCKTNEGPPLHECIDLFCPYGKPGDILWVREAFSLSLRGSADAPGFVRTIEYQAGGTQNDIPKEHNNWVDEKQNGKRGFRLRPSIHMPRWASRITLEITGIRVERLQDISEEDAKAEGISLNGFESVFAGIDGREHRIAFADLWRDINGSDSWDANPWVWVVEFKKV